jgi:hypothetical protein
VARTGGASGKSGEAGPSPGQSRFT